MNTGKTKAIALGSSYSIRRFRKLQITSIAIKNDGDLVQFIDEVISLEFVLNSTLSWGSHINSITKKVNRAIFGLRFIRHCTMHKLRQRLVKSPIMPHLDYCSVVYLDGPLYLRSRLQRLANERDRYIFGLARNVRISPFRRKLGWMRTDLRREFFALLAMNRIVRMGEPPFLLPFFKRFQQMRPMRGPRKDLVIPSVTLSRALCSFQVKCVRL